MATKRGVEVLRPDETCSGCRHLTVGMQGQEPENPENKLNFLFYTYLLTHASHALLDRLSSDSQLVLHFFVRVAENSQKQDFAIGLIPMSHHIRLPILSSHRGVRIDPLVRSNNRSGLTWVSVTPVLLYLFVPQNQANTHNRRLCTAKFQQHRFPQFGGLLVNSGRPVLLRLRLLSRSLFPCICSS
jgi:hypothetical protein